MVTSERRFGRLMDASRRCVPAARIAFSVQPSNDGDTMRRFPRITAAAGPADAPPNVTNDPQSAPPQNQTTVLPSRASNAPGVNRSAAATNLVHARPGNQPPPPTFPFTDLPAELQLMVV